MKNLRWVLVLAMVFAAGSAAMADPIRLPCSHEPVEVSLFGASSHYGPDGQPRGFDSPTLVQGDELRGIFYSDAISYVDPQGKEHTAFNPELDGFEITGCVHGLELKTVNTLTMGAVTLIHLEYVPGADQTVGSGLVDEDGDPVPGAGGRATLYADYSPDFTWDPDRDSRPLGPDGLPVAGTPDEWVEGPYDPDYANEWRLDFGTAGAYDADGNSELGGEVDLLFDGVFVPCAQYGLSEDPEVVLIADLFYFPAMQGMYGIAQGFANSIRDGVGVATNKVEYYTNDSPNGTIEPSGIVEYRFGEDAKDTGGDLHFFMDLGWGTLRQPRLTWAGETGWAFSANDPVHFINTPEPATTVLFGIPLGVLLRRLRRRRRRS